MSVGIRELGFIFCSEYGAENDCEVGSNETEMLTMEALQYLLSFRSEIVFQLSGSW